jgi:aerobic-type carbon monoxide dehydrogenase small subunit (CoxS/CutS family)
MIRLLTTTAVFAVGLLLAPAIYAQTSQPNAPACSWVMVDGKAIFSCLTPWWPAALEYHHSRRARHRTESKSTATRLIEEQAAQCGNCTAGMIMRAQAQLERM